MTVDLKNIQIRDAAPQDVRGINNVVYQAWLVTYPNEEYGITREDIEDDYKDVFTEESITKREESMRNIPENQKRLVAVYEGKIVGVSTTVRNEDNNQLRTIYILPEFQGKGIGKMLYAEAIKFCDKNKKLIVQVATYTTDAIEFYKKLGFVDKGNRFTEERFRFKSGVIIPEMELEIEAGKF